MTATQSLEPDSARVIAFRGPHSRRKALQRRACGWFKEALLVFSERQSTENTIRYLAASRELRPTGTGPSQGRDLPPAA
jgi:hypothetical protein